MSRKEILKKGFTKNITNKKNKVYVFLICILISSFIWFLIKMSKEYNYEFDYTVHYSGDLKTDAIVNSPDTVITLYVKTQGFKLLRMYLSEKDKVVDVDLSKLEFTEKKQYKEAYLRTSYLLYDVIDEYRLQKDEYRLSPDSIYFRTNSLQSKKLPVKLDVDIQCSSPYHIAGELKAVPDSVIVYATADVLKTKDYILTENMVMKDLTESEELSLSLICNNGNLSQDKVKLMIAVEKYTEKTLDLPIQLRYDSLCMAKGKEIKVFPEIAEVKIYVPMSEFENIGKEDISLFVFFSEEMKQNDRLKIQVDGLEDKFELIRIVPETVEYIIIK